VWFGTFLKLKESSLAKAMLGVTIVWAHFCKNSNVTTKVAFGYGCHMEHFNTKVFIFTMELFNLEVVWAIFFQNYKNTSQGECW
jgi:hypothetical protein